jgi:hypothetical protein
MFFNCFHFRKVRHTGDWNIHTLDQPRGYHLYSVYLTLHFRLPRLLRSLHKNCERVSRISLSSCLSSIQTTYWNTFFSHLSPDRKVAATTKAMTAGSTPHFCAKVKQSLLPHHFRLPRLLQSLNKYCERVSRISIGSTFSCTRLIV